MKKLAFCAAVLATLCLMSACSEKEGVYSPKKKIAKVYEASTYIYGYQEDVSSVWFYDTTSSPKTLAEEWTWDGSKLSKITFYETGIVHNKGEVSDMITFTYDGKQVTRIEGYDEYMTITYDGSKLKQVQLFEIDGNKLQATMDFVHDGKKITKINITGEDDDIDFTKSSILHLEKVLFRDILPTVDQADRVVAAIGKTVKNNGGKGMTTVSMELTWTGDNVTGISMNYMGMAVTGTFTFDNKNNPYQNFLLGLILTEDGSMIIFNKNNVTKSVMKMEISFMGQSYTETIEENYSYTYDGNWPITRTMKSVYMDDEDEGYSSESEVVTYFEYK